MQNHSSRQLFKKKDKKEKKDKKKQKDKTPDDEVKIENPLFGMRNKHRNNVATKTLLKAGFDPTSIEVTKKTQKTNNNSFKY